MSYYFNSDYLKGVGITKTVKACKALIKKEGIEFDSIAVRGCSGMLIGAPLAMQTKTNLLIVRKDAEDSHSSNPVEGWGCDQKILILDDFIASGHTINNIYSELIAKCQTPSIVGILLYASSRKESTYKLAEGDDEFLSEGEELPLWNVRLNKRLVR